MGLFRITHMDTEKIVNYTVDGYQENEWEDAGRIDDPSWEQRYIHEALIVKSITEAHPHIKKVLELGSGPGALSQKILNMNPDLEYHLVDKPFAKKYFEENNFTGKFFVKNLSSEFDTTGLDDCYDLVITNDFLEHITNPHIIVRTVYELMNDDSVYLISNPNWRMGHTFLYRGLFDFDNFVYFLWAHGFDCIGLYPSNLKTPKYPRLDSESLLPEEMLYDWNHYLLFKKRKFDV